MENRSPNYRDHTAFRKLNVDLDQYTEGDLEFKKELVPLLINNIRELRGSLPESTRENKPEIFLKACHKVKLTVSLLNDQELNTLIAALVNDLKIMNDGSHLVERSAHFDRLCNDIISSLENESA